MRVKQRAINAGTCLNTWDELDLMGIRFKAREIGFNSLTMLIVINKLQIRKDRAFKSNAPAQKLDCARMRHPCPLPAMEVMNWLYRGQHQSRQDQSKQFEVRFWQDTSPEGRLRVVEQSFIALALGSMARSRGVPRRGGRSGIRIVYEEEEQQPVAPMAAMDPSSSSSEEEFLLLPDSYQTIRLRIPGRLLRSDVILNFSVYLSEAALADLSSSSPASENLQSSEILLGDMLGRVYRVPRPLAAVEPDEQPPQAPVQTNSTQAMSVQEIPPPGNATQDRREGQDSIQPGSDGQLQCDEELVIWLDSPSPELRNPPGSPSHPS